MYAGLLAWALAPEWAPLPLAAALLGAGYDEAALLTLIEIGAIDAECDDAGAWLVETQSLIEYREALAEVMGDEG